MIKKLVEKEMESNQYLWEQIQDPIIKERIAYSFEWYTRKALTNKYMFYTLTAMTIVCPVISGIVLGDGEGAHQVSMIFMGLSTIAAAFLTMTDARKKWGIYRTQAEILKKKLALYKYSDEDEGELLKAMEASMEQTHEQWSEPFKCDK